jgi:beta-hydroxyacyl-ACP dehydratase FabZ
MNDFKEKTKFDLHEIIQILPHRYPFLLIDKIEVLTPGESVTAIKNITVNEPYFQGHFPGQPIMPAVFSLECIAQAGAFLLLNTLEDPLKKNAFISAIDGARFRKPVVPGDQMRIEVVIAKRKLNICRFQGSCFVDNTLVAGGLVSANIVDRAGA